MGARFVMSAPSYSGLDALNLPEVAFTGRSNVGKSSLAGTLMGRANLVRTSRTPGRTQLLNLFVWDEALAVMDLPGYGYAKLSKTQRAGMSRMVQAYLAGRDTLRGVVLVLDARRDDVTDLDRQMIAWILRHKVPLLVAMTKADLVPKNRRLHQMLLLEKALGIGSGHSVMCSAKSKEGLKELTRRLFELKTP